MCTFRLLMIAWSLCSSPALIAQNGQLTTRDPEVRVEITRVDSVALVFGLDSSALRGEIEQKVFEAGIKIRHDVSAAVPVLRIRILVSRSLYANSDDLFAGSEVDLIRLDHNPKVPLWSSCQPLYAFRSFRNLAPGLHTLALENVDDFLAFWRENRQLRKDQ